MNKDVDSVFMARCFELANLAQANGESPVGSVITDSDGNILAESAEACKAKNDITCHAEVEAIRAALGKLNTNNLSGAILYSSHEPCILCSYAIRHYGISRVVYAHTAGETGGITSVFPVLSTSLIPKWGPPPEINRWGG